MSDCRKLNGKRASSSPPLTLTGGHGNCGDLARFLREHLPRSCAKLDCPDPGKTLRASAGTYYELANPGMGHVFLGNTRDVFLASYYDPRREPHDLPRAPDLPK